MADIAFLLLIFFLVATTMNVDTGLVRMLPPMPPENQKQEDIKVKERNLFLVLISGSGNIMAGLRSIGGGEIHEYTTLLEDTRRQALDRMVQNATAMGANAVISMRFDSSELAGTMSEIVAYGTAVVVVPDAHAPQASE